MISAQCSECQSEEIQPSAGKRLLERGPVKSSGLVTRKVRDTIKLPERLGTPLVPPRWGNPAWHRGESRGYGNNPMARDNRQPSPTDLDLWVQFRD